MGSAADVRSPDVARTLTPAGLRLSGRALEILAAARDEPASRARPRPRALPQAPVTASACAAALGACRELRGSRRLPAADYLIAAAAAERGFGVLHLDAHSTPSRRCSGSRASGSTATDHVPAAIITTPHSAMTTPVRCTPRTRSPSSAAASSTVVTGYSELATATVDSSPIVVAVL